MIIDSTTYPMNIKKIYDKLSNPKISDYIITTYKMILPIKNIKIRSTKVLIYREPIIYEKKNSLKNIKLIRWFVNIQKR